MASTPLTLLWPEQSPGTALITLREWVAWALRLYQNASPSLKTRRA
jgi:hypothetical protein